MKKYMSIALLAGALAMSGCGSSNGFNEVSGLQGNPGGGVVVAPVCADDAYATNQNATLTVNAANGVLSNDSPNGGTVTAFDATGTQGGAVAVNADGSFTYTPANNFTGNDTFTYTVTNGFGSTTCNVTITVSAVVAVDGFFVDAANGNDGTGSFQDGNPFATIQAAVTAAGTNQDIVVRPGTYTQNVTLLDGQRLLGSGSVLAQGTVPRPVIDGAGIILANGNTVDYIRIQNSPDDSIDGDDQSNGTISNCEIINAGGLGAISARQTLGTWIISDNFIDGTAPVGIGVVCITSDNPSTDEIVYQIRGNTIQNCDFGAIGLFGGLDHEIRILLDDNTTTDTVNPGGTIESSTGNTAQALMAIVNNFNDDTYAFGREATSILGIERLSQLTSINSGSADVTTLAGFLPPTEIDEGDAGF